MQATAQHVTAAATPTRHDRGGVQALTPGCLNLAVYVCVCLFSYKFDRGGGLFFVVFVGFFVCCVFCDEGHIGLCVQCGYSGHLYI